MYIFQHKSGSYQSYYRFYLSLAGAIKFTIYFSLINEHFNLPTDIRQLRKIDERQKYVDNTRG